MSELDLSLYRNSLDYFFEEVVWPDTTGTYDALKKDLAYIGTRRNKKGLLEIEVSFPESATTINVVQERLRKLGIVTKHFS